MTTLGRVLSYLRDHDSDDRAPEPSRAPSRMDAPHRARAEEPVQRPAVRVDAPASRFAASMTSGHAAQHPR
ncbi:MAG: hypothetical protein J0H00_01625 [Burkholderiales bacterium]|nr:hypothetical protein [Burkholderiales bacterium]